MPPRHLLHVFSTFRPGGPQVRFVTLANALGSEFSHTIVSMDGSYDACQRIDPKISTSILPPPADRRTPHCALAMARMARTLRPDLTLSYNWGAMDAAAGFRLANVCPHIHVEDGFGPDEAVTRKRRRSLTRRLLLNRIHLTVVPSKTLLRIARTEFGLRPEKLQFIPNGIDVDAWCPDPSRGARRLLNISEDTFLAGSVGHLRPEKALDVLVRAFASAKLTNAKLLLVGDGSSRPELEELVRECGLSQQVIFVGAVEDSRPYFQALDLFVMSSATEQMPISLLEAMACGLPAMCTGVGDSAEMLDSGAPPAIVPPNDPLAYARALADLAANRDLRIRLGQENRARCAARYSCSQMVQRYAALYRHKAPFSDAHAD